MTREKTEIEPVENKETLENLIENLKLKIENIAFQLKKDIFKRYRECGTVILDAGYQGGKWHGKTQEWFAEQLNLSQQTIGRMIRLAWMTNTQFDVFIRENESLHTWMNPQLENKNIHAVDKSDDLRSYHYEITCPFCHQHANEKEFVKYKVEEE